MVQEEGRCGVEPYYIPSGPLVRDPLFVPTERVDRALFQIMRGLQLQKAILLEGERQSSKKSMVEHIGRCTGNLVKQVTLCEQTDIVDLLGSDVPEEKEVGEMTFTWQNGILLEAIQKGHWLVINDLNLASQSVLEGLNSILDHRGSVFIPELNQTYEKHPTFRLFAVQGTYMLGEGRKQLPASFLNRFTKIHVL